MKKKRGGRQRREATQPNSPARAQRRVRGAPCRLLAPLAPECSSTRSLTRRVWTPPRSVAPPPRPRPRPIGRGASGGGCGRMVSARGRAAQVARVPPAPGAGGGLAGRPARALDWRARSSAEPSPRAAPGAPLPAGPVPSHGPAPGRASALLWAMLERGRPKPVVAPQGSAVASRSGSLRAPRLSPARRGAGGLPGASSAMGQPHRWVLAQLR